MNKRSAIFVLCVAILLGAGLVAKPEEVFACSCAGPLSAEKQVKDELERKTAIFAGKVTKVTQPRQKIIMSSADLVKVNFEVSKVWKGELQREAVVYTAMSSASCGIENFQVGTEYLVSAYEDREHLETNICDLTKPLASAEEEVKILGAGYSPKLIPKSQETSVFQVTDGWPSDVILSILTIMFIIVGAVILMLIKHRKSRR